MDEVWRDVVGYEGLYQVSSLGRVKSVSRTTTTSRVVKGKRQTFSWCVPESLLKFGKRADDYRDVPLTKCGKTVNVCVHRLVAEAFLPNPSGLRCVNHLDGDKSNNRVENLEWCSFQHNNNHAVDLKLNTQAIQVYCKETQTVYPSMSRADRMLGLPLGSVSTAIRQNRPIHGLNFELHKPRTGEKLQ